MQASAINQIPQRVWDNCGLWVAQYANMNATGYQSQPWLLGRYGEVMRQYTSNGRIPGYSGALDLNRTPIVGLKKFRFDDRRCGFSYV